MQVHQETIRSEGLKTYSPTFTREEFSVEVTVRGKRSRLLCLKGHEGTEREEWVIHGLAAKFSQGAKVWPAFAYFSPTRSSVYHLTTRMDRRGHLVLVGFAADFEGKAVRSRHNAVA